MKHDEPAYHVDDMYIASFETRQSTELLGIEAFPILEKDEQLSNWKNTKILVKLPATWS